MNAITPHFLIDLVCRVYQNKRQGIKKRGLTAVIVQLKARFTGDDLTRKGNLENLEKTWRENLDIQKRNVDRRNVDIQVCRQIFKDRIGLILGEAAFFLLIFLRMFNLDGCPFLIDLIFDC